MKLKLMTTIICAAFFAGYADLNSVAVPTGMLHQPNTAMGIGFSGKVNYTLTPLTNDSVFVNLQILPIGGGPALALTEVSGDVGAINVNTNLPNTSKTYSIFFQTAAPQAGVQYFARITANAVVTATKTRVDGYLASMTKNQEAILLGSNADLTTCASGPIPSLYTLDGPHGVNSWVEMSPPSTYTATVFATDAGIAATWDTTLARIRGEMMGEEFRAYGRNCALAPAGNLVIHPQQGRASEYHSEDPLLSGLMMAATVTGLQNRAVMPTIKHYACNQMEYNRGSMSAKISERNLRELYLYNWEPSIVKAQGRGIMGAYNRINGSYSCSNRYIMSTVLREEWGWKYTVVTDWGAAFDNVPAAMQWGSDIHLPNSGDYTPSTVSTYSDSLVSVHARRIINSHFIIGDLETGYNRYAYQTTLKSTAHYDFVKNSGAQGIVLARNTGNILPLPKTGKKIAILDPFSSTGRVSGGGSCWVNPVWGDVVNIPTGISSYLNTLPAGHSTVQGTNLTGADYIIVVVGPTGETEAADRPSLAIQSADGDSYAATALAQPNGKTKTIVVYYGGSAAIPGNWSNADAIVIMYYPGMKYGASLAQVLFGDVNPSGKLPVTFPQSASQLANFTWVAGALAYARSDSAHGYFRVDKMGVKPLFYFGHGLSYTTFSYSNLRIYPTLISAGDRVQVKVDVENTGSVAGKEVVQLYLSMPNTNASLPVRVQDLRGFNKVLVEPGAGNKKTVTFTLTEEEMRVFKPATPEFTTGGAWTVLPGTYGVRIGTSADRTALPSISGTFTVQ